MSPSIRIEVDFKAVGQLLKSDEVRDWALKKGEAAADAAGDGFIAKAFYGRDRVSVIVTSDTLEAQRLLYQDSTVLARALNAARD